MFVAATVLACEEKATCQHENKSVDQDSIHLRPFVHEMFDIVEIDNRTFTQIFDVGSECWMLSNFEVSLVIRIQEIPNLCRVSQA